MGRWIACVILVAGAAGCGSPSRTPTDASEQPVVDAPETNSGEFAAACSKHTDCEVGYCVEPVGDTGGVCTRECNDDCPTDWECRTVDLPQVDLKLCVPAAKQLCLACVTDDECGGGVCLTLDGVGRCATPCTDLCASGYECVPDASGTNTGNYCQPVTGSCSCSAELDGAMRSCSNANAIGTCFGTQTCNAGTGWSACTARTPADETCNGVDDDCDFVIDDGTVPGNQACNNTNAFGSCEGVRACDGMDGEVCLGKIPTAEACNFIDDDCDVSVDEGFAGLGSSCTAGIGACTRYGSQRCNMAGDGLVCSAVAGQPVTEVCNQIDDNCNNQTDEAFPTLGQVCSSGLGVCTRYGSNVCRTDGTDVQCSVTPNTGAMGTEVCNYLDDNCDGTVDNGFRDGTTGVYNTNQHCGACGTDCTVLYNAANSFGACQAGPTSAVCAMQCNTGSGNLNGSTIDGCEFTIDPTAIYVSTTDASAVDDSTCGVGPTGTGGTNHPCKTITQGIARAVATSRTNILVADGTYAEGVTLSNGKNVLGGYRADTWERHLSTTATVISGSIASGNHDRTVVAIAITSPTVFEGFVVRGSFNSKPSGNSYAVYISGSTPMLTIQNNQIFAGRGGTGAAGMTGTPGAQGVPGGGAVNANDNNYNARTVTGCSGSGTPAVVAGRAIANGAVLTCGGSPVNGGNGGGNWCPPSAGANPNPQKDPSEQSGRDGLPGQGTGAGAAGDAGDDSYVFNDGNTAYPPIAAAFGLDGSAGSVGTSASVVAGCSNGNGSVSLGNWVGGSGAGGGSGTHGAGGGGGGAGGGGYCADCANGAPTGGNHRIGGHGGGGGSGGCGGGGGGAGAGGGGAFGIFVSAGTAPTISSNTIVRGDGGRGGSGGVGGAGGLGGAGGAGGLSDLFGTDKAGRGGDGGNAGHGSGGGGGCGGSSFGIFTSGVPTPPAYCGSNMVSGGAAGLGGGGGFSGTGNTAGAGAAGVLQDCVSL